MTGPTGPSGTASVPGLVAELVRLIAPRTAGPVERAHRLVADLGYHSLALAELCFSLEDLFGLEHLPPEDAEPPRTLGDLTDLVLAELATGAGRLPDTAGVRMILARYDVEWTPQTV